MTRLLVLLAALALGALSAGCGGTHCSDAAECEGGNETDQEACEIQVEALYEQGEIDGCTDRIDAWQDCMTDSSCGSLGNTAVWGNECSALLRDATECLQGDGVVQL